MTDDVVQFLDRVGAAVADAAGTGLRGVYAIGSLVTGDWRPETSDVDVLVAVAPETTDLAAVAEAVVALGIEVPAAKLELVVYDADALRCPRHPLPYLLNINAGPGHAPHVSRGGDPAHWFLLDVAIARDVAVVLAGPPLSAIAGTVPRGAALAAVRDALSWFRDSDPSSPGAVLNACRSWRFAVDDVWSSKDAAARWARERLEDPAVVTAALDARTGEPLGVDVDAVTPLVNAAAEAVESAVQDLERSGDAAASPPG